MTIMPCGMSKLTALALLGLALSGCGDDASDEQSQSAAGGESEKVVELNLGTFDPPEHVQTRLMSTFSDEVAKATDGQVKIRINSGGALGSPAEVYDNILTGLMDIGYGLHGYNPGMWDVQSVMHLPFLADAPAERLSVITQNLYSHHEAIRKEYAQFEPLYIFAADPYQIITKSKKITRLEDMKGLKVRSPSREANDMIRTWGATPVNMPSPEIYDAMQKGVIDGAVLPFSAIADFSLYDTIGYITVGNFNTALFYVMANKDSWGQLSSEQQQTIKQLAGVEMSRKAGKAFDDRAAEARQKAEAQGIEIVELPQTELERFKQAAEPVTEQWLKEMQEQGVDGQAILNEVQVELNK